MKGNLRNPKAEQVVIRIANAFLLTAGLGCALALLYVVYHYHWIHDRHFAGPAGRWLYCGLPALLTVLFLGSLRLRASRKIKFVFISTVLATGLFVDELILEGQRYLSENWPSEITEETGSKRATFARRLGVSFDMRTRFQVIADLRKKGVDAFPPPDPLIFESKNLDGTLTWNVSWAGHQLYPLGGIANKTTVFCNENGAYAIYDSDEHGFHNPGGIWSHPIDIAAVGDSFTHGACVPPDRSFVSLIRKLHPATLNLGVRANGPLSELATLVEYLPPLRPKLVLWFYFEGNDVIELAAERRNPVLLRYLEAGLSQHLVSRQTEIDQRIRELVSKLEAEVAAKEKRLQERVVTKLVDSLVEIGTLSELRQRLGLIYSKNLQVQAGLASEAGELDPELLALLRKILSKGKDAVDSWHGSLYFVYLPDWERYAHPERAVKNREAILQMVRSLGLPLIDLHPTFQAHHDPLSLFPFRGFGHYNEAGHALVAHTVLRSIAARAASTQVDTPVQPIPISGRYKHYQSTEPTAHQRSAVEERTSSIASNGLFPCGDPHIELANTQ
jgi:hypothetical protein